MINRQIYNTKIGPLLIVEEDGYIIQISFNAQKNNKDYQESEMLEKTINQINEYLAGQRKEFDLKIKYDGTKFQQQVYNALEKIPYGTTCSYLDIAKKINNPKAVRAVGQVLHRNPIAIIVPCHRVIGKNGKLVGFAGGLDIKEKLLTIEMNNR